MLAFMNENAIYFLYTLKFVPIRDLNVGSWFYCIHMQMSISVHSYANKLLSGDNKLSTSLLTLMFIFVKVYEPSWTWKCINSLQLIPFQLGLTLHIFSTLQVLLPYEGIRWS